MNLLLFGGTFDPPHSGHLAMATRAVLELELDRVIFLPARRNPLKQSGPLANDAERLHWLRLATAGIPWAEVNPVELERAPPSYSWQTIEWAHARWPEAKLHWLLGADQWQQLRNWARIDWLDAQLTWVVCERGNQALQPRPGSQAKLIPNFTHPASSSAIRAALRSAQFDSAALDWLPSPLCQAVLASQSYRNAEIDRASAKGA